MPIYEYRCDACGHQEEFLQKVSDKPVAVCPKCGKRKLKKMLSAAGFQLKGSGWYATDFKGGKKAAEKKTEAAAETKTETKSDAKADAKPDSKPATTTN
jgi:putative FmdB family regulatory protein